MGIKNIIFDLGGVLLEIHYQKSVIAFAELGLTDYDDHFKQDYSSSLFEELETGAISEHTFCNKIREIFHTDVSDDNIKKAWNAMLGNFIPENLNILTRSAQKYKVYLFSNTNKIHQEEFMKIYQRQFGNNDFDNHFIKAYYSHSCGWRKPNAQAYINLLETENLVASETLFIDDTLKNIEGAIKAGLKTYHLAHPELLTSLNL